MNNLAGVGVVNNRSDWNFQQNIVAFAPRFVRSFAVAPALGFVFRIETEMNQRVVTLARFHNHVAALAAVAAGRPSAGHELLPAERKASVASVPSLYPNCGFINEHNYQQSAVSRTRDLVIPIRRACEARGNLGSIQAQKKLQLTAGAVTVRV